MRFLRVLIVPALILAVWSFWPSGNAVEQPAPAPIETDYSIGDVLQVATGEQPVANVTLTIVAIDGDQVTLTDVEGDRRTVNAEWLPNLQPLLAGMTDDESMVLWMRRYPGTTWIGPEDGNYIAHNCHEYGECGQRVTNYVPSYYPTIVQDAIRYPAALTFQTWVQTYLQ